MLRTLLINDHSKVPQLEKATAVAFLTLIVVALIVPVVTEGTMPLLWPLMVGLLSSALLFFIRPTGSDSNAFMRVGFYLGLFAFFICFPILSPDEIRADISDDTHRLLGLALLLTVLGFEISYWIFCGRKKDRRNTLLLQTGFRQRRWLLAFLIVGLFAWFFSVWDYSQTLDVPIERVLLSMRGRIQGGGQDLAKPGYLALFLGSGIFLSATAASLLLTSYRLPFRNILLGWVTLLACVVIGFLSGSRALFLYSFVPVAVTGWKYLSRLRLLAFIRWPSIVAVGALIIIVWGAMSAMRGADVRDFEGGLEEILPVVHAQGALDIYSMTAMVVQSFPDRIPYVQGESLVPLVFGWIPRTIWESKPYPFGLYVNIIRGETLPDRGASLAVGLTGEGYGNFGLLGAFLWGLMAGVACRAGDKFLQKFKSDDPLRLLLAGMATIWIAMIVRGGVPEMFYMGLQVTVLPFILTKLLSRKQKVIRETLPAKARLHRGGLHSGPSVEFKS